MGLRERRVPGPPLRRPCQGILVGVALQTSVSVRDALRLQGGGGQASLLPWALAWGMQPPSVPGPPQTHVLSLWW